MPYALLADLVLAAHLGIVLFVLGGLAATVAGNLRGWPWVNRLAFRLAHAAAIAVVAAQAWLGVVCPLTTLEMALRARAGQQTYEGAFIGHWLQALLYFDAPPWAFTLAYSAFGVLVLAVWLRFPPRRKPR
jgi:polyferredoxin